MPKSFHSRAYLSEEVNCTICKLQTSWIEIYIDVILGLYDSLLSVFRRLTLWLGQSGEKQRIS